MSASVGLLEIKSIPMGYEAVDSMLKVANVELLKATPACPGKFLVVVCGQVADVKRAITHGAQLAPQQVICHYVIGHVHDMVRQALQTPPRIQVLQSLGIVETRSALAAIRCADAAVTSANVELVQLRVGQGLGGKGVLMLTGEVSAVRSALEACFSLSDEDVEIKSSSLIASPHKTLVDSILKKHG